MPDQLKLFDEEAEGPGDGRAARAEARDDADHAPAAATRRAGSPGSGAERDAAGSRVEGTQARSRKGDRQVTRAAEPWDRQCGGTSDDLERRFEAARETAARIPASIRFGTSSWAFPGWAGLVYPRKASASALAREGLRDYVRHPLLRTVGIDRSYYAPIPDAELERYAEQLPPGFPCCAKAPAAVTSLVRPDLGPRSTEPNPSFLSAGRFVDELAAPFARVFGDHTGPFILQFPPAPRGARPDPSAFVDRLDRFLDALPRDFRYAVEVRQRDLLGGDYAAVLARHGAAHVYNFWSRMPTPGQQAEILAPESQPFVVIRLLLRPGATYDEQREQFAPFDRIQAPADSMRAEVTAILRRAVGRRLPGFVLVNNKAEGSAPLTIEALAGALTHVLDDSGRSEDPQATPSDPD